MRPLSKKVASLEKSQTLALSARAKKLQAEGVDVVSLTAGEPDFPTPEVVKQAAIMAIHENFTKYTANQGIPELLKAISFKLQKENNLRFEPSQVLVSCGAKHSVYNALCSICNKGDEVIIPSPYWVSYPEMVKLVDAVPVLVKTSPRNQFKITPAQLRKAVTRRTKAFILNSPCNPTGAVYTREELIALAKVIEKTDLYVLSDEIYEKVLFDGMKHFSIGSVDAIRDQVVTINGVSKAYSMTGWRIGYLAAAKAIVEGAEKVQSQMTSNATSIAQKAAYAAISNDLSAEISMMVGEFDKRRQFLIKAFKTIKGLEFIYPQGAFYLFFNVKAYLKTVVDGKKLKTSDDLCEFMLTKHHVAMVPGTGFGDSNWVRMSYACSMQELEKAVDRLKKGFSQLARG
ncbi:MAG: pyridoxal phosphate-dependent aminotransferase [Ignavibacteriales bacterium]|nr:pyridoxal phosphate-dependent aminotransferase [Ignavibacteriales bacterium]